MNFTIIIPTYNRSQHLKRNLNFYDEISSLNYRIIIADSSTKENKLKNKDIINSFPSLEIIHLDDFHKKIRPFHKVYNALSNVKDSYSVFCADDDFITPNAIKKCVDFLENNPEYACAQGDYVSFKVDNTKKTFFWREKYIHQESITFSNPEKRLKTHMSNYMQTFYSVHKTDILKKSFKEAKKNSDDFRFGEILPSMITLIHGKMKKLDVFYAARESNLESAGRTTPTILDFIEEGSYNEKYKKFRTCLSKHLSKKSDIDFNQAKKIIDDSWHKYLNSRILKKNNYKSISTRLSRTLTSFNLPNRLDHIIREYYNKIILQPIKNSKWNVTIPDTEYYKDLKTIRKHVLEHNTLLSNGKNKNEHKNLK